MSLVNRVLAGYRWVTFRHPSPGHVTPPAASPFPVFSRRGGTMAAAAALDKVPDVDIDVGTFKYVLIRVCHSPPDPAPETSKYIVRGYTSAGFHSDVYDRVTPAIESLGLDCECVGGGRIIHKPDEAAIKVYGYSQGYGKADHSTSVEILKRRYPDYTNITYSDDGY